MSEYIPSSVDETLIVLTEAVDDIGSLAAMVKEVNSSEVKPEDQLSNNIYEYDAKTHSLRIAFGNLEQNEDVELNM